MPLPLLQTKLYVPPPRPQLVARPAITTKLHASAAYPLTLIAAPAGFSKTTLVSEWIIQTDQPVAWLSLDDDDNDPGRFLLYLVAALRSIHSHIGETTLASLQTPQLSPLTALLTPLLNDLSQLADPFVLVLDDYHLISAQPIHNALIFLIEHLPPTLRLIITSRMDPPLPLARWRVRGQLAEVRADDLRFDATETATFFNGVMGLQLTEEEIARLETRTEGWIAGLQLAALSMQERSDVAGFIQSFSGSHRHVFSYLIEEVLNQRPAGTLDFLLQTAILERFNADLCNAVTGRSDSQTMLDKIEQANLFLIPLDDERRWFRYHHLFAEVLQHRLQPNATDDLPTLHLRASIWFEAAELPDEAIQHALAAQAWERAAQLVETYSIPLLLRSEITRINAWLQWLPTHLVESRPQLALAAAWIYVGARQLDALTHSLNELPALQSPDLDTETQSQLLILRACLALFQGRLEETIHYARQGLPLAPAHNLSLRASALFLMGAAFAQSNDGQSAEPMLREAIAVGIAGGNLYNVMLAYYVLSRIQSAQGMVAEAITTLNTALQIAVPQGQALIPAVGVIYVGLGALQTEPERYIDAIAMLQRGDILTKACFQVDVLLYGWEAQVNLHLAHGNLAAASAVVDGATTWLNQVDLPQGMRQKILHLLHSAYMPSEPRTIDTPMSTAAPQNFVEPLSAREREILHLVVNGLSNQAIADEIIVTVGTVKKHLNNIYGKLGVASRTQAIARGRELGLLTD
ncbi:MAG: LuxR C-terminal-related transcriptional regulator [Caldilineaceae bacterium]